MMKCIAIDEEPLALKVLENHIRKIRDLDLKEVFLNPVKALDYLSHNSIDFVLLDIQMPDLDGLAFAKLSKGGQQVVFTTAYNNYAVQGFELSATDYLMKPISFERFLEMFEKVKSKARSTISLEKKSIFIKDGSQWLKMELDNLLFLKADDNYVIFQEQNQKLMARMTLAEAFEQVDSAQFLKVHRSFIINFSKVTKIEKHQVFLNQYKIPIAKKYRQKVEERMGLFR